MSKRKRVSLLLAVSLVICIMPCGEASAASKKINLSKKRVTLYEKESCKISLKTANRKRIKWYSSNKKIVTVKNGLIKARAIGRCVVTAKYEGKKYTCDVCVKGAGNVSKSPVVNTVPPVAAHAVPPVAASAAPMSPPRLPSMVPTVTSDPNGDAGQDHGDSEIKDYDGVVLEANMDASNRNLLLLKIVNHSGADIVTGCNFMLEYYDGNQWTPVCFKAGVAFIEIGIIVRDGGEYAESVDLERYFTGLSDGMYRIKKEIWWASDQRTIQTEFMIEGAENASNQLGVSTAPPVVVSAPPSAVMSPTNPPSVIPIVTSDPNGDAGQDHGSSEIKDYDGVVLEANTDASNKYLILLKMMNHSGADIMTGYDFTLEYYNGSQWTPVSFKDGLAFICVLMEVRDGGEFKDSIDLERYSDELPDGRYRITKQIWWASDHRTVQAEFMIG